MIQSFAKQEFVPQKGNTCDVHHGGREGVGCFHGRILGAEILCDGKTGHVRARDGKRIQLRTVVEKVMEGNGITRGKIVVKSDSELVVAVLQILSRTERVRTVIGRIGRAGRRQLGFARSG